MIHTFIAWAMRSCTILFCFTWTIVSIMECQNTQPWCLSNWTLTFNWPRPHAECKACLACWQNRMHAQRKSGYSCPSWLWYVCYDVGETLSSLQKWIITNIINKACSFSIFILWNIHLMTCRVLTDYKPTFVNTQRPSGKTCIIHPQCTFPDIRHS